ncbi:MAG: DNA recombination and repair protein RecF [Candidatus Carbobacillus altaicus]|uniref:DNA replication and repair protein RecF n=1 Tax=Candidatus Carbonibacillus altaicus TaxID=2163959 RepID=A0A2R6Y239_9BACL|nr:MAG: DNA recombination and repair protein RecF [Candidatus Carbobacillus altaicus]
MHVQTLSLKHFRNYSETCIPLFPGINVFVGENGSGKTNLLEALVLLSLAKSPRGGGDKSWVAWGEHEATVRGWVNGKSTLQTLTLTYIHGSKQAFANEMRIERLMDFVGLLKIVLFVPEDLQIVGGSPRFRRRLLDTLIGQLKPLYLYHLNRYNKLLVRRNQLLKQPQTSSELERLLDGWDDLLSESAAYIIAARKSFIMHLKTYGEKAYGTLSQNKETLSLMYRAEGLPELQEASVPPDPLVERAFLQQLKEQLRQVFYQRRELDRQQGHTTVGPHRDDLLFFLNGRPADVVASQGQKRSIALAIKLAEVETIVQESGEVPLVLLDDVFSELDDERSGMLVQLVKKSEQSFITTASFQYLGKLKDASVYTVTRGRVRRVE